MLKGQLLRFFACFGCNPFKRGYLLSVRLIFQRLTAFVFLIHFYYPSVHNTPNSVTMVRCTSMQHVLRGPSPVAGSSTRPVSAGRGSPLSSEPSPPRWAWFPLGSGSVIRLESALSHGNDIGSPDTSPRGLCWIGLIGAKGSVAVGLVQAASWGVGMDRWSGRRCSNRIYTAEDSTSVEYRLRRMLHHLDTYRAVADVARKNTDFSSLRRNV